VRRWRARPHYDHFSGQDHRETAAASPFTGSAKPLHRHPTAPIHDNCICSQSLKFQDRGVRSTSQQSAAVLCVCSRVNECIFLRTQARTYHATPIPRTSDAFLSVAQLLLSLFSQEESSGALELTHDCCVTSYRRKMTDTRQYPQYFVGKG
jgi:hypothetical protein